MLRAASCSRNTQLDARNKHQVARSLLRATCCAGVNAALKKVSRQRPTTGISNMAAQTGNSYVSGTSIDSIEIPTAILGFLTMASSNKVSPNYCDNDQQMESNMADHTGNICITVEITFGGRYALARFAEKLWPVWEEETPALQTVLTMPDERLRNCKVYLEFCTADFRLTWLENAKTTFSLLFFVVVNVLTYMKNVIITAVLRKSMGHISSSKIYSISTDTVQIFPVWAAMLLFSVVGRCRNHLGALSLNLSRSKIPELSLEFRRYLS